MQSISISDNSNLEKSKQQTVIKVEQGLDSWGEPKGYLWWWEIQTMSGKSYKVSEQIKDIIVTQQPKFVTLPDGTALALHQITEIVKKTEPFGGRSGTE